MLPLAFLILSLFTAMPQQGMMYAFHNVPQWPHDNEEAQYEWLCEATFLERYSARLLPEPKHIGLFTYLLSQERERTFSQFLTDYDGFRETIEDCTETGDHATGEDSWEYRLSFSFDSLCTVPARFDPTGNTLLTRRGASFYRVRNGIPTRLGPSTFGGGHNSQHAMIVADIDFDGTPEYFLLLSFGSAGQFYLLVDEHGTNAAARRLFAPYLEPVTVFDYYTSKANYVFGSPRFDLANNTLQEGSGGLLSWNDRTFHFENGVYRLQRASAAVGGSGREVVLGIGYELNPQGQAVQRFASPAGYETPATMLLLAPTDYYAQINAEQWNAPKKVRITSRNIGVLPTGTKEYKYLLDVPFALGNQLGTLPANTWVQLLDMARLPDAGGEDGKEDDDAATNAPDAAQQNDTYTEETYNLEEVWCKVQVVGQEQKTQPEGWIPCQNVLLRSPQPITVHRKPTLDANTSTWDQNLYITKSVQTLQGQWLRIEQQHHGFFGWLLRSELETLLQEQ